MAALQITITDAGRAEIINAANTGTAPVEITEVGLGTGQYTPDPAQTALTAEVKRLNTISGEVVADDTIHVTGKDEGGDAYDVAEFGLFTASGTLFAVYSQASGPFMQKAAQSSLLLSVDVILGTLDATNLTFGDTSFSNPPASETVAGVIELADTAEATAGTNNTKAMTPAKVLAALNSSTFQASEIKRGSVELATEAEALAGTDDQRAMTPFKTHSKVANYVGEVVGTVAAFAMGTPPAGWLKANGAAVSRASYADLFARIGTTFGAGDGSTTFNLPDLRGEFVRGWDDGRGIDPGRLIGSSQKASLVSSSSFDSVLNDRISTLAIYGTMTDAARRQILGVDQYNTADYSGLEWVASGTGTPDTKGALPGGANSATTGPARPRNVAMLYCIKY